MGAAANDEARVKLEAELASRMLRKFEGHWHPDTPERGSGYRHISCGAVAADALVTDALEVAMTGSARKANVPQDVSMWVDPGSVSIKVGSHGALTQIHPAPSRNGHSASLRNVKYGQEHDHGRRRERCRPRLHPSLRRHQARLHREAAGHNLRDSD